MICCRFERDLFPSLPQNAKGNQRWTGPVLGNGLDLRARELEEENWDSTFLRLKTKTEETRHLDTYKLRVVILFQNTLKHLETLSCFGLTERQVKQQQVDVSQKATTARCVHCGLQA